MKPERRLWKRAKCVDCSVNKSIRHFELLSSSNNVGEVFLRLSRTNSVFARWNFCELFRIAINCNIQVPLAGAGPKIDYKVAGNGFLSKILIVFKNSAVLAVFQAVVETMRCFLSSQNFRTVVQV